jgi:CDP-diacylglycerol--inositol 3-phosphatidyltransferase
MAKPQPTPARKQSAKSGQSKSPKPKANSSPQKDGSAPATLTKASTFTYVDVYFFIPNLIGYTRVVLTAAGIWLLIKADREKNNEWILGLVMYTFSFILDFFDGYFARMFSQSSNFGAVLDMVTDRVSTMLLLVVLCSFYPNRFEWFAFLAALDYSSHWVQMYAAKGHHKTTNSDKNIIVRTFYGVYPFFGFCCVGTEIFYVALAALHFKEDDEILNFLSYPLFAACVSKNVVNVAQLCSGFEAVAKRDAAGEK